MSPQFQKTLAYFAAGGVVIGWMLFMGYGLAFEVWVMPSVKVPGRAYMSYGQQAGVFAMVAGLLCAAGGAALALVKHRQRLLSAEVVLGGCLLTASFVGLCWQDDIAHWGQDPSAHVLYEPFVVLLPAVIVLWLIYLIGSAIAQRA